MKKRLVGYKKALQSNYTEASRKVKQREEILAELRLLGEAFVFVLDENEKTKIPIRPRVKIMPPLPLDIARGFYGETDCMLSLDVGAGDRQSINLVRCQISKEAYPCDLIWDGGKARCKSMRELRAALNVASKRILIAALERFRSIRANQQKEGRCSSAFDLPTTFSPPETNKTPRKQSKEIKKVVHKRKQGHKANSMRSTASKSTKARKRK